MKRDLFTELVPTQYYQKIIENNAERKDFFVLDKKKELSYREKLIKLCETSINQRFPDGRIFNLDSNGNYSSHSVSPYSKSFEFNIEDRIKDLVFALKSKSYFTISSCEGHGPTFRRYVSIIFPSEQTAIDFTKRLPFKLIYKIQHASEVFNNNVEVDSNGNVLDVNKRKELQASKDQAVEYVNCFIRRPYADAWLLEMIISPALLPDQNFIYYLKNIKTIIFKKVFMNRFTKKITRYILSDKFEPNLY